MASRLEIITSDGRSWYSVGLVESPQDLSALILNGEIAVNASGLSGKPHTGWWITARHIVAIRLDED